MDLHIVHTAVVNILHTIDNSFSSKTVGMTAQIEKLLWPLFLEGHLHQDSLISGCQTMMLHLTSAIKRPWPVEGIEECLL